MKRMHDCIVISDFNSGTFSGLLNNDPGSPEIKVVDTPFDQVERVLTDPGMDCWKSKPDIAFVWTMPEKISPSFGKAIDMGKTDINDVLEDVDRYCAMVIAASKRVKYMFHPAWLFLSGAKASGLADMRHNSGVSDILMQMNLRLNKRLSETDNIYVLDSQKWVNAAGIKKAYNPKLWYMGKIAFGSEVFKAAVNDLKTAIVSLSGGSKKIIILDLDDTLWGGIVGDAGWENITLGGHDGEGESFVDFQKSLLSLKNRGVLLAVVSKNEEKIALEAIEKHPEMRIKKSDLAGWRINWDDKAKNISELVSELNLGLQSVVFIDDNPAERDRVRAALPEVLVPEWPDDKMLYKQALMSLNCFDTAVLSKEDLMRSEDYLRTKHRETLKKEAPSFEEWLKNLGLKVKIEEFGGANAQRTVQLLNKTNQMNLSTRRMSQQEIEDWLKDGDRNMWVFSVSDRLGDSGLTGILSIELDGEDARIVDFVLSCRVMGRHVEDVMLHKAVGYSRSVKALRLSAEYLETPKNKPCYNYFSGLRFFKMRGDKTFVLDLKGSFPAPDNIEVIG